MSVLFPDTVLRQTVFDILEFTATAGVGSPIIQSQPARWRMRCESRPLMRTAGVTLMDWLQGQKGGVGTFWAYDILRGYPRNYKNGIGGLTRHAGGSFDGTATVTARTTSTISLSTLPSTYAFKKGDHIGLSEGSNRSLHVVAADVTAAAGVAVVTVYPPVATAVFSTSAVANVLKPVATFRLVPGSIEIGRDLHQERVAFEAQQVFYQ
ncbi:MAG TPA: hypothetical protein PLV92_07645 [Pirellulaceae bacterium]|nr:hypothetical protein [Pirellulaceae bacterium]